MTPVAIAILSLSMSADAFAAAIGRGAQHRPTLPQALRSGLVFGVIEAITPLIGFALGIAAASFVAAIDHWIAFGLLGAVGGKMIWEALKPEDDNKEAAEAKKAVSRGLVALVATAVGTSIDAGAVGVGLALLGENIWLIAACIGLTTFALATLGLLIGKAAGTRLGKIVELVGGVALIALGLKILLEHLGVLAF
ncbi:manganese efflux pump MntP family protein [Brevundimonas sp. NPDC090276]|uniref:manganese efflux pump MntP n=1 Tax=Brevundimonas sp. NPDC090276 TaxID=3363956 RepID=UPI003839E5BA